MELNKNINKYYKRVIISYKPLLDWFINNEELLINLKRLRKIDKIDHYSCNQDIVTLLSMYKAFKDCMEKYSKYVNDYQASIVSKNAALSMARIYEDNKKNLSKFALDNYFIDVSDLLKNDVNLKVKK